MNPMTKIKLILFGLSAYMLMPLDLLPDAIPFVGECDNMAVMLWGVNSIIEIVRKEERTIIGKRAA